MKRYILGNTCCKRRFKVIHSTSTIWNDPFDDPDFEYRFNERFKDCCNKPLTFEEYLKLMEEVDNFE